MTTSRSQLAAAGPIAPTSEATVVFSNIRADLLRHRHHYIANWRSRLGPTVWVESLGSRNPRLADLARLGGERAGQDVPALLPEVVVCRPGAVPVHGSNLLYRLDASILARRLRQLDIEPADTVAWVYLAHPAVLDVLDREPWLRVVYDLCDEISDIRGVHPRVHAAERELLLRADVVIASSTQLVEKALAVRGSDGVAYVPNGVDASRFSGVRRWSGGVRVASYIGSVFEWFDEQLVAQVADALPDVTFRIVGPVRRRLPLLRCLPNVELPGPVPADEVPREFEESDLLIVPFRSGPLALATDPLKVYEALAAGRAVLATEMPQVRRFAPAVRIEQTATGWVTAIRDLDAGRWQPELEHRRGAIAASEDWRLRIDQLTRVLGTAA